MAGYIAVIPNEEVVKAGPKAVLKTYKSPPVTVIKRGEYTGKAPAQGDLDVLRDMLRVCTTIECMTVAPHSSVLHNRHLELLEIVNTGLQDHCAEAEWGKNMLRCCESVEERHKVAGGLSMTQYRGTAHFWSKVHTQLRRRCAEKALAALLLLKEANSLGHTQKQDLLSRLANILKLDSQLVHGFMNNGFDAHRGLFVRVPSVSEGTRTLCALGAPLGNVPLPVHPRIKGVRLGLDGSPN